MASPVAPSRHRRRAFLAALTALLVALALPALGEAPVHVADHPYGFQGEGEARIDDLDARVGSIAPDPAQEAAASALGATVRWNDFGTPHVLTRHGGVMSGPAEGAPEDVARGWVAANRDLFRLTEGAVASLEVLRVSPLWDSPDLGRIARGEEPLRTDVAHVVLFRQQFDGVQAGLDGLLTVGLTAAGEVAWSSSSVTGDTEVRGTRSIDAVTALRIAAGDVGREVAGADLSVVDELTAEGFTTYRLRGVDDLQYTRPVAVPTPDRGVRAAWETVVLDSAPAVGPLLAFISFIDAETGDVLYRTNRVDHLADGPLAQVAEPSGEPFNGQTKPADCGDPHPFTVGEGNGSIQVTVAAIVNAELDDDITIDLYFDGSVVASQDFLTSPEVLVYSPSGGVPAGEYSVVICPFNPGASPISYTGLFSAQEPGAGGGATPNPRWRVFPANPPFAGDEADEADPRETWCWRPGEDCDRVVGMDDRPGRGFVNGASRLPWDVNPFTGQPSFTTDGNNASTAISEISFLSPDTVGRRPISLTREYDFAWTNAWNESNCDPSNFQREDRNRNDEDAATANLFTMHNRMHDWGYHLGWTEGNSNLQQDNFGNTGPERATDPELGQSQAGRTSPAFTGRDNANQITLQDGIPGITNQYLWQPLQAGFYAPCVDGAYDMGIVAHEVGHAIQNRMTAGPDAQLSGDQARSMGESWSDLTAIEYLNGYGFVPIADESPFAVGAYATGAKERGIRNYNMSRSPLNFGNIEYDGNGTTSPHADGEIWSAVNYDLRQRLIADHDEAFPASDRTLQRRCADGEIPADLCPGNRRWVQIMHDAFLLQPGAVSMVDARDAQLAADVMRFGGENQRSMWDVYAVRGLGRDAASEGSGDRNPVPDFASPLREDNATVRFQALEVDGGGVPQEMDVYVGVYEARSTPLATASDGEPSRARAMVPATYQFIVRAPGYGAHRFVRTFAPGQDVTVQVPLRRNAASRTHGAVAAGDGGNLLALIDDTEATNWASVDEADVRGKQVTVELGGGATIVRQVQVSAALRPALSEDPADEPDEEPPYDTGGQNRFSALRQFRLLACDATTGADCAADAGFREIYVSSPDAFPAGRPRPTAPDHTLRPFTVPQTRATHLRIEVVDNHCTGGVLYTREANPDDDPINDPDCVDGQTAAGAAGTPPTTSFSQVSNVRISELQVFSVPPPAVEGQQPGTPDPDRGTDPVPGSGETVVLPGTVERPPTTELERVRGSGRIETAVALSQRTFESAERVVLARADAFPDALASATLAAEVGGPILLTPSNVLAPQVAAEITRLGASEVYLAGGTAALSPDVERAVKDLDVAATRLGGRDRFGTAALIAQQVVTLGGPVDRVIVARADRFPDALAAGNVAIAARAPVLLTPLEDLHPTTASAIDDLLADGQSVVVAGGTAAVSAAAEQQIRERGYAPRRVSGSNRFATAVALADEARLEGAGIETALLASGADFPDALAAGPVAARLNGVLLLVDPTDMVRSPATRVYLEANAADIRRVLVAGGPAAVSDDVARAAAVAAGAQ